MDHVIRFYRANIPGVIINDNYTGIQRGGDVTTCGPNTWHMILIVQQLINAGNPPQNMTTIDPPPPGWYALGSRLLHIRDKQRRVLGKNIHGYSACIDRTRTHLCPPRINWMIMLRTVYTTPHRRSIRRIGCTSGSATAL